MEENPPDMHQVQEKGKKQVRKCVAEGFPPFIVEDFYTGKFGWEVERCLHSAIISRTCDGL